MLALVIILAAFGLVPCVIGDARVRSGRGQPLTAPAVSPAAYWSTKNE